MAGIGDLVDAIGQAKAAKVMGFPFYIYVLSRDRPFYVGKGQRQRIAQHFANANRGDSSLPARVIRKTQKAGGSITCVIDSVHCDEKSALARERELIASVGRRNNGTGTLVNLTDGGEGVSGLKMSPSTRAALSATRKAFAQTPAGRQMINKIAAKRRGQKHSDEHKAKIAAKLTGRPCSESTRQKIGLANSGRVLTAERRSEISESLRGKIQSLATRSKRSKQIEINGIRKTLCEWASETGLPIASIRQRLNRGWNPADAISAPLSSKRR
jgi:hypothetical protein